MVKSNDIFGVISYIWNWCNTTVLYYGEILGISINFTIGSLFLFSIFGSVLIWLIRLVFGLADE